MNTMSQARINVSDLEKDIRRAATSPDVRREPPPSLGNAEAIAKHASAIVESGATAVIERFRSLRSQIDALESELLQDVAAVDARIKLSMRMVAHANDAAGLIEQQIAEYRSANAKSA